MSDASARVLRLLGLLQNHRFWRGDDLAERLEVSPRTLRRDIERVRGLGYRVDSTPGPTGGYQLVAGGQLPPLALDSDEAVALVVGLRAAMSGSIADVAEASVRALTKVMQMLPPAMRSRADALRTMVVTPPPSRTDTNAVSAETLGIIAQACRDTVRLRFGYTARGGAITDRSVEPYRLVTIGRRWYLVAFDMDRNDWRTFRADRMTEPVPARNAFSPRPLPADDLVAFVQAGIDQIATVYEVDIVVRAPAAQVAEFAGQWATVTALDESTCRLQMATDSLEWPIHLLATIPADFDVRAPAELQTLVSAVARRFARSARRSN